jgi:hypothetical protein
LRQFNGQTVTVAGISGQQVTINLNASGQGSAFSGSEFGTYVM